MNIGDNISEDKRGLIIRAIQEIEAISNKIPGVIIIHSLPDFVVRYMSELGLVLLKRKREEIVGMTAEEYHRTFFNEADAQDYVPRILDLLKRNTDDVVTYFQQVRTSPTSEWDWYMSMTKILLRDEANAPILSITVAMKIDAHHYFTAKATRLLQENEFLKKHYDDFSRLTKREREVLRLIVKGKSSVEISKTLGISETTADTHRKNIRKKINIDTPYELYMYAHAFDLV